MWKRPRLAFVTAPPAPAAPRVVRAPRRGQQEEDDEPATVSISTAATATATAACLLQQQPSVSTKEDYKQEGGGPSISTPTTTAVAVTAALAGAVTAAALVVPPRQRGPTDTNTNTNTSTRAAPVSFPRLPEPKPGDLVAWLPPPTLQRPPKKEKEAEVAVVHPPVAMDPPPTLFEQAFMLSKYAPRLSAATGSSRDGSGGGGGCDGAPSYAAAAVPQAALGVVAYEGKWLFYSQGHVYMADAPMCRATQGALLVLRAAEGGGAAPGAVLARAMAYAGARYEVLGEGEEKDGDATCRVWRLLAAAAGTEGNARYACWATSVAGAHLRTPIERGPLTHHAVDTGEGTVVHYSGGEIRLDDIHVLLVGKEALAPHRLTVVNGSRLARATEQEVLGCLARLTSRLGERRYCVLTNNCETLSAWATCTKGTAAAAHHHHLDAPAPHAAAAPHDDPLPPISSQVQAASLAVGSVVGGLGALILGAVTAPALAVPVLMVSGAAVGSAATYTAVATVAVAAQRELRALQAAKDRERGSGGGDDDGFVLVGGSEEEEEG